MSLTLTKRTVLVSVAGGMVLFVWGFLSHAVLPWYDWIYQRFTDEAAISDVLQNTAPQRGFYYLPYSENDRSPGTIEALVNVLPRGNERSIGSQLLLGVTIQIISVFLVISLLGRVRSSTYWGKVGLFSSVGFLIGFVSHAYYWNWFGFPWAYVVVTILDTWIAWSLAGLTVARFLTQEISDHAQ